MYLCPKSSGHRLGSNSGDLFGTLICFLFVSLWFPRPGLKVSGGGALLRSLPDLCPQRGEAGAPLLSMRRRVFCCQVGFHSGWLYIQPSPCKCEKENWTVKKNK